MSRTSYSLKLPGYTMGEDQNPKIQGLYEIVISEWRWMVQAISSQVPYTPLALRTIKS